MRAALGQKVQGGSAVMGMASLGSVCAAYGSVMDHLQTYKSPGKADVLVLRAF